MPSWLAPFFLLSGLISLYFTLSLEDFYINICFGCFGGRIFAYDI